MSKAILLICIATVAGCAFTNVSSFNDPKYAHKAYKRILIESDAQDYAIRKEIEFCIARDIKEFGAVGIMSCTVMPPTREYTAEDFSRVMTEQGIEAILKISTTSAGADQRYYSPTYVTNTTASHGVVTSTTKAVGGGTYAEPWAKFTANLYDAHSFECAWTATANSRGTAYTNVYNIIHSMTEHIADKLNKDNKL